VRIANRQTSTDDFNVITPVKRNRRRTSSTPRQANKPLEDYFREAATENPLTRETADSPVDTETESETEPQSTEPILSDINESTNTESTNPAYTVIENNTIYGTNSDTIMDHENSDHESLPNERE